MKIYSLLALFLLAGCDWFPNSTSSAQNPKIKIVMNAIKEYNKHNMEGYAAFFSENMNLYHTNGLSNTRIATGLKDFKGYNYAFFSRKAGKIEVLNQFYSEPWVFTHQKNELGSALIESTVGYRFENDKIADVMIIGERKLN